MPHINKKKTNDLIEQRPKYLNRKFKSKISSETCTCSYVATECWGIFHSFTISIQLLDCLGPLVQMRISTWQLFTPQ